MRRIRHEGVHNMTDVANVTELPVLPHVVGETVSCSAVVCRVGGRMMLALPYQAGFGPSRGRRYRITIGGRRTSSQLVMVVGGQAMIPFTSDRPAEGDVVGVTLRVLAQRPSLGVPEDFVAALAAQGLGLDAIASHELNQLVTMIKEADDPGIRGARIENAVAAVAELTATRTGNVHDR
jgi:hypothetical protein